MLKLPKLIKNISDPEPLPDKAICSACGWKGSVSKCETELEGDWENGYYKIHLCLKCEDGGCIDDYDFSNKQWKLREKWKLRQDKKDKVK